MVQVVSDDARGRRADRPREIPRKGWRDVLVRVKREIGNDNASLIAAGLALYALLAIFPGLAAVIALYGLFTSPDQITDQLQSLAAALPQEALEILMTAMQNIASQQDQALSVGAIIAFLIALWSARKGMVALMKAMNIAYNEEEHRGFFRQLLVSLAFTVGAVAGFVVVALIAVVLPIIVQALQLPQALEWTVAVGRWIFLWFVIVLALSVVYRFAPNRATAKWRWVTWGSAIAAALWILASILFAVYVRNFGSYGETYGALGGVIVLLLWLYLTGFIILLGAELNSELEHQTRNDTTTGRPKPMGERGAYAADTLGRRTS